MYLFYICVGVFIWEDIWVFFSEDMVYSVVGDNFEVVFIYLYFEGDFCKIVRFFLLFCIFGREGIYDSSFKVLGSRKW